MYAPTLDPVPAPVVLRLIGVLDTDLIASFGTLVAEIGAPGRPLFVDVRDLTVVGEKDVTGLVRAIASARVEGRDVRLDAPTLSWRRAMRSLLAGQPAIEGAQRSAVRRTVILAHTAKRKHR